ncbi:hypothetical protein JCM12294_18770 [Desulfocicer niacini]
MPITSSGTQQTGEKSMFLQDSVKQHLIDEYGLSAEDVEDLFESAKTSVQEGLDHLYTYLQDNRFDDIASAAHTLKGNFLNMGLDDFASLSQHLEEAAKEKRPQDIKADYALLIQKTAALI